MSSPLSSNSSALRGRPVRTEGPVRIGGIVQHYAWGRAPTDSIISELIGQQGLASDARVAELWFGDHSKASSPVLEKGISGEMTLHHVIQRDPLRALGPKVAERFSELPFLFKVLSIGRALSIQAHPDARLAKELHQRDPQHYPDDRHKPEIGVALSRVTLLHGFCPLSRTLEACARLPPLRDFFGADIINNAAVRPVPEVRKAIVARCFSAAESDVTQCIEGLKAILCDAQECSEAEQCFIQISKQYPSSDAGLLSAFYLNYVELASGEAVFIGPNIPHAYLEGELLECMANSDNVVRAGLTEKFRDLPTLMKMLAFEEQRVRRITPQSTHGVEWYKVPAEEFCMGLIRGDDSTTPQSEEPEVKIPVGAPSIFVLIRGSCVLSSSESEWHLKAGDAWFVPADCAPVTCKQVEGLAVVATCP